MGQNSVVGKATTVCGSHLGGSKKFSLLHTWPDWLWDPFSLLHSRYQDSFPRVKKPGHGAEHPALSSTEVNPLTGKVDYSWCTM